MVGRNENGKLKFESLRFEIFLNDMFEVCNTAREVEWLHEQISGAAEITMDERLEELDAE